MSDTEGQQWDKRPVPDPTVLTTEQLMREIGALRGVLEARMDSIGVRIDAIDKATTLRLETIDGIPGSIDEKVSHLATIMETRFDGISGQFRERDTRSERESRDNKVAVDAAFAAQKEAASEQNKSNSLAISKSEAATAEALVKLSQLVDVAVNALRDKLDDLQDRIGDVSRDVRAAQASAGGTTAGAELAQVAAERTRTLVFGVIAAIGVLAAIVLWVIETTGGQTPSG